MRRLLLDDLARTPKQHKQDALNRHERDTDTWGGHGRGRKRDPLSGAVVLPLGGHHLAGSHIVLQPDQSSNLQASGKVRLGIGPTRHVVLIEGSVHALARTEIVSL
jgi:hypothetical protein